MTEARAGRREIARSGCATTQPHTADRGGIQLPAWATSPWLGAGVAGGNREGGNTGPNARDRGGVRVHFHYRMYPPSRAARTA